MNSTSSKGSLGLLGVVLDMAEKSAKTTKAIVMIMVITVKPMNMQFSIDFTCGFGFCSQLFIFDTMNIRPNEASSQIPPAMLHFDPTNLLQNPSSSLGDDILLWFDGGPGGC